MERDVLFVGWARLSVVGFSGWAGLGDGGMVGSIERDELDGFKVAVDTVRLLIRSHPTSTPSYTKLLNISMNRRVGSLRMLWIIS